MPKEFRTSVGGQALMEGIMMPSIRACPPTEVRNSLGICVLLRHFCLPLRGKVAEQSEAG